MELDPVKNTVWVKLPFIEDLVANLKPNRFVAERVFNPAGVNSEEPQLEGGHGQVASEAGGQGPCR